MLTDNQKKSLESGQAVLVFGASGGCGSIAVQLAKRCLGASRVVGVCSGANAEAVKSYGADSVVDYTAGDTAMIEELQRIPFDIAVDTVTSPDDKDYGPIAKACLKPGGLHVAINGSGGSWSRAILSSVLKFDLQKRGYHLLMKRSDGKQLAKLAAWVVEEKLKPVVASTFPMTQPAVEEAYKSLKGRRTKGKLVCVVPA